MEVTTAEDDRILLAVMAIDETLAASAARSVYSAEDLQNLLLDLRLALQPGEPIGGS